jgi:PKD repeat protein
MGTLILTGPNGGGFGGALTYNWSNGIITRRDTISMTTPGSYPYTLIVTNAGGCSDTATRTITVLNGTQPVLTVTPSNAIRYCTLTSTSATVTIKGATSYTWNNTNGVTFLSSANDSASVTPAGGPGGGNYTITGTTGSCSSSVNITVAAVNPPNPGFITNINRGVDSVCAGTPVILRAQNGGGGFGGGATYLWDSGKTSRNDTITVNSTGWSHVAVSTAPGCSVVDSIQLFVIGGSASFTYIADSTFVQFTDLSPGATSWTWDFGDTTALDFTQNPTHNYAHHGLYTVILTVNSACGTYTDTMQVGSWASGINNIESSSIYAYPNPVKDYLNISFKMNANNAEMTIINALGQVMESKTISSKSKNGFNEKVNMQNYPNGVYSIKVKSNNELVNVKVIKSNN